MSREDPQMKIRLPAELKAQIETAAKDSNRTLNAEILARLQTSFNHVGQATSIPPIGTPGGDQIWQDEIRQQLTKLSLENRLTALQTQEATLRLEISSAASQVKDLQLRGATDEDVKDLHHALAEMYKGLDEIAVERGEIRANYDHFFKRPAAEPVEPKKDKVIIRADFERQMIRSYNPEHWDTLVRFAEQKVLDRQPAASDLLAPKRSTNARRPLPKKPLK